MMRPIIRGRRSAGQLRDALSGRDATLPPTEAVRLLSASRSPRRVGDLVGVLRDRTARVELRHATAIALGRIAMPGARRALLRELASGDDATVLSGVLTALAHHGERSDLARVQKLARRRGVVGHSARFAQLLIAARFALPARAAAPTEIAPRPSGRTVDVARLPVRGASSVSVKRCLADMRDELPRVSLSKRHGVAIRGHHLRWMTVLTEAAEALFEARGPLRHRAVLGVVALATAPREPYRLQMLLLAAPAPSGRTGIVGVTTQGQLVLTGTLSPARSGVVRFEVGTPTGSAQLPVRVQGVWRDGRLSVELCWATQSMPRRANVPRPTRLGPKAPSNEER